MSEVRSEFGSRGQSKSGWPVLSWTLRTSCLSLDSIEALAGYLASSACILIQKAVDEPDKIFPIYVEIDDSFQFSEKSFWQLTLDVSRDPIGLVTKYVNALCDELDRTNLSVLPFNAEEYCFGSHAIFSCLELLGDEGRDYDESALPLYESFLRYIARCDLDVEVHQDRYICGALDKLSVLSETMYLELLWHRLFRGQQNVRTRTFDFFLRFVGVSRFRAVIEFMVSKNDVMCLERDQGHELSQYVPIIASVYGSDKQRMSEVLDAIRSMISARIVERRNYFARGVEVALACDAHYLVMKEADGYWDTGYHKYDRRKKVWLSSSEA